MNATPSSARQQQQRITRHRSQTDSLSFFNILTSRLLFDKVEQVLPPHRERLFPPTETLSMFLAQVMNADQSLQQAVNEAAISRLRSSLPVCSIHSGGYCRARQRLPLEMVTELTRYLGEEIEQRVPDEWRWHGRRVLLVDGTTVTMPDTPSNQAAFPQQGGQLPGLGFPICRIVGITSLATGAILNAAIGRFNGKGSGERGLLREIQDTMQSGDVLLGDAFYPTYFFLATMQERGVDVLMEQDGSRRRSTDYRRGQRLGHRDHLIVIDKPKIPDWMNREDYEAAPANITIREFHAGGKTMVTTLVDVHKNGLKELYRCRWHIELDIRQIKDTMGMNILRCKMAEMATKEIWVHLLGYNLIRLMMSQSALMADIHVREISFKHCLQLWSSWLKCGGYEIDSYLELFALMAKKRVANRPGRIEPRAVKRRPKAYSLLTKPRDLARQLVLEFGHPKKLK